MVRMGYRSVRLEEICKLAYGAGLPARDRIDGSIPVYGSNGIVGHHNESFVSGPTVVIGRKGSVGAVHFSENDCWPIDTTYHAIVDVKEVNIRWLFYALRKLRLYDLNKAAAVPGLNRNDAYDKVLLFPSLPEQKRIAAILDKADALRQKRKQSRQLLDEFIRSVFLDKFGDPGKNPKKWEEKPLGDVIQETQYGTSKPAGDYGNGLPILRMNNITNSGEMDLADLKWIELSASEVHKYTVQKGDLLFNRTNSPELVGKTAVWESDHQFAYAGYLVRIRLIRQIANPCYVSAFLNSGYGKRLLFSKARASINMSNISPTLLKEFSIPIPPIEVQNRFEAIAKATKALKDKSRQSGGMLNDHFDALVQRAFRGEL